MSPNLVQWRLDPVVPFADLDASGQITIKGGAPDAKLGLIAQIGDKSYRVGVDVVSRETYDQLLSAGNFTLSGESRETSGGALTESSISTSTATAEDSASTRKFWFVALSGGTALLLGGLGLVLLRQSGRRAKAPGRGQQKAISSGESRPAAGFEKKPSGGAPKVCPACGTKYAEESQFCGQDGTTLIRAT